jgi:hypothetical protein
VKGLVRAHADKLFDDPAPIADLAEFLSSLRR